MELCAKVAQRPIERAWKTFLDKKNTILRKSIFRVENLADLTQSFDKNGVSREPPIQYEWNYAQKLHSIPLSERGEKILDKKSTISRKLIFGVGNLADLTHSFDENSISREPLIRSRWNYAQKLHTMPLSERGKKFWIKNIQF